MLLRPITLVTFILMLVTLVAAETTASEKSTICNTDEDRKSAKYWSYDPVDGYEFGLKIQNYVEQEDLQSLFDLVKGELTYGPRKKSIQGKLFSEVFSNKWREEVLSEKPSCVPIGWRGFMLAHGQIWYQQDNETNEWKIFSITGAKKLEASKTSLDGGWKYNRKLLSRSCFTIIWMSGDNYEDFYDPFVKGKGVKWDEFEKHIGRYIGGMVPIKPIIPSWAEKGSNEKISLAIKLSECLQNKKLPKIKIVDGWVSQNKCLENSPDRCLPEKYRLIKKISLKNCQLLAPHFSESCIDLGLIQTSDVTGGSMGNDVRQSIYGIVKEPNTQDVYVMPLKNFGSLNDALNYVDKLKN